MKILIAAMGHFHDRPTGSARVAWDEAAELARQGEDVWVLATGPSSLPEHETIDGVHLLRYFPARAAAWNPSRGFAHQKAAAAALSRYLPRVDAVHGHVPLAYLAALDFYGASVRTCYTIHSPVGLEMAIEWRNSNALRRLTAPFALAMIRRLESGCLRRSEVLTALSRYTISRIGAIHGPEVAKRIYRIPGWADTSQFVPVNDRQRAKAELGWPTGPPTLFTLRRLTARMGLDRLLGAAGILLEEGIAFHLAIGGDGPLRGSLEAQAKTLGLQERVTFLGRVDDCILPRAYAACDAFVLPTAELECFGLIALEALSAGRPVLATPVGAIPEIVGEFEPCWLAASASVEHLADLLRRYLANQLPEHPPSELHQQVHRDYGRERMLTEFLEATLGHTAVPACNN